MTARRSRPDAEAVRPKVLPGSGAARATAAKAKCVDAGPCIAQGGYSPMTNERNSKGSSSPLGALRGALMGSVSTGILHASKLPVTVVKHG